MSAPCEDCVLIAVCKNKYFVDMKQDCSLIEQYLFCGMVYNRRRKDFSERIEKVKDILSPKLWDCGEYEATKNKYFSYRNRGTPMITKYFNYSGPAGDFK